MTQWTLHEQLAQDTHPIGDLALSRLLLMNDQRVTWMILVPRRIGLVETFQLDPPEQHQLMDEITAVGQFLQSDFGAHKINMGALGNIVSQLHVHVIGRLRTDPFWPRAVWGQGSPVAYEESQIQTIRAKFWNSSQLSFSGGSSGMSPRSSKKMSFPPP